MSENQNRGINGFANYDSMATEELEEILRLDAEMPEGQESDTDTILYIMEVLAERKRSNSYSENTALKAYESFKQNYLPEADRKIIPMKTKRGGSRWVRRLTAAAAVLAILFIGSLTANAFGLNIWKAVIQRTQEAFYIGNGGNSQPNSNLPYTSLQDALEQGEITAPLAPTWFPDGYELTDIRVKQTPLQKIYRAEYIKEETLLVITVRDHLDGNPYYVEQSDGLIEEYTVSGITYYLFKNNKRTQAVWIVDSYECCISGEVTIDELKMMINSIEKG